MANKSGGLDDSGEEEDAFCLLLSLKVVEDEEVGEGLVCCRTEESSSSF
jgi:hypothetical protein